MAHQKDNIYNKPIEWLFNEKYRWIYHVLFWMVIYADEITSFLGVTEEMNFDWTILLGLAADMAMVYSIIYFVLPRYLLKGKYSMFLLITTQLVVVNSLLQLYLGLCAEEYLEEPTSFLLTYLVSWMVNTVLIVGVAVGFKIFKNFIRNEIKLNELENENLKTELVYLKNQMNPHFLFNALNNIYVLNRKDPNLASETILKLSDLLRYQLYYAAEDRVLLNNEIDYLKNFLDMDKIRKDNTALDFQVTGNTNGNKVAPFIFLPFIENAIKHGGSENNEQGYIKVQLTISEDQQIEYIVKNSKPSKPLITETGGIGLTNVKRRLEIVYPKQHNLQIEDEPSYYKIHLSLNLKETL